MLATTTTANTTANTTTAAAKPSSYKVDLFVQPDPFADKVDNKATETTLKGTAVAAAVKGVTGTKFGDAVITAEATTEAAVAWKTKPAATASSTGDVTITATTDVAAYVYCAVAKNPARRMLATTTTTTATTTANATNATNKTATATTTASTTAAATKTSVVSPTSKGASATYNI